MRWSKGWSRVWSPESFKSDLQAQTSKWDELSSIDRKSPEFYLVRLADFDPIYKFREKCLNFQNLKMVEGVVDGVVEGVIV